jgi:hypothetical protein
MLRQPAARPPPAAKEGKDFIPQVYVCVLFLAGYVFIAFAFSWLWSLGAMLLLSVVTAMNVYSHERQLARAGATVRHHVLAGVLFGAISLVMPQWSLLGFWLWKNPYWAAASLWVHANVVVPVLCRKDRHQDSRGATCSAP